MTKKKEKFCSVCGKKYTSFTVKFNNSATNRFMIKNNVCRECALWMNRKVYPRATEMMIDGSMYMTFDKKLQIRLGNIHDPTKRRYFVMMLDTMTSREFKDIIEEGVPPENFMTPDEATFISKGEAYALRDGPFECKGCTCLDRYTCLFYFREKTEGDRPANKIPENWKDGGEMCHNYININNTNKHLLEWRKKKQGQ